MREMILLLVFSVSEPKIHEEEVDTFNYDKVSLGSDMNSLSEFPKEVEDKLPPAGCELGNLKEKNLMQRDGHNSKFWTLLQHDEAEMSRNDMLSDFFIDHVSFQPLEIPSTTNHGSDFAENSKAYLYGENEYCVEDPCYKKNGMYVIY